MTSAAAPIGTLETRLVWPLALIGVAVLLLSQSVFGQVNSGSTGSASALNSASAARVPLYFEENRGQAGGKFAS